MDKNIPINSINDRAVYVRGVDKATGGFGTIERNNVVKGVHRDRYYSFWFLKEGAVKIMVDFKTFQITGPAILCIMPGQVHQGLWMENVVGWFVAANVNMVPHHVRTIFEESLVPISPVSVDKKQTMWLNHCAELLHGTYYDESAGEKDKLGIIQSLLDAYTTRFGSVFAQNTKPEKVVESRALQLTRQFRILLRQQFKTVKSPSEYARHLNISAGYLTEIVKKVTGQSVSYWIQQEILTEARRLLFYTELTIKEIANELGYNDHAYFSRLFSALTGESASVFRQKSRK